MRRLLFVALVLSVASQPLGLAAHARRGSSIGPLGTKEPTKLHLRYDKDQSHILAEGHLEPALPGEVVEVILFRKRSGSFKKIAMKDRQLDEEGRYEARFDRPARGMCKINASFAGNDDYKPDSATSTFNCGLPVSLGAYSPEQLPARTEKALERIDGVRATTVWSGSKFLKSSRVSGGGSVDNPPGSYTIPLDVAFIEPNEFARFAQKGDRAKIRSLDGRKALFSKGEVGLRRGHDRLRMRFTVGRARSIGSISNASAQGYEVLLSQPAAHASVAFRTVLIEKAPNVERARIAKKLRRIAGHKPLELSSEKEVPYLRHAQLVRPQLFIKKVFGEFYMRPTSGRSIEIGGGWPADNIRSDTVPILGQVTCHRKIFPQLRGALREVRRKGLAHTVTRSKYVGCYVPRFISSYDGGDVGPVKRLSRHAWGTGLDINARSNPFGSRPQQDPRLVRIMKKWGMTWGGRWALPDGMHFEWERFP